MQWPDTRSAHHEFIPQTIKYAVRVSKNVRVYLQRGLQIERTTSPSRTPSPCLVVVSKWPPCHVVLASGRPPGELKVRPPGSPLGSTMTLVKFLWGEPFEGLEEPRCLERERSSRARASADAPAGEVM